MSSGDSLQTLLLLLLVRAQRPTTYPHISVTVAVLVVTVVMGTYDDCRLFRAKDMDMDVDMMSMRHTTYIMSYIIFILTPA